MRFSSFSISLPRQCHTVALCALHRSLPSDSSAPASCLKAAALRLSPVHQDQPKINGLLTPLLHFWCCPLLLCTLCSPHWQPLELFPWVAAWNETCRPHPWLSCRSQMEDHQVWNEASASLKVFWLNKFTYVSDMFRSSILGVSQVTLC